jgi:basic amino acid/polyamine antiporter, APA family
VPSVVPLIGIAVSIALLTQIESKVFARAGVLIGLGALLWLVNALIVRRQAGERTA